MQTREALVARLRSGEVPEILIVGGGINGVGAFRDLAAQGIAALLVEAGDFASGTSAAPSRLIHGGLRYLETGEAGLVRESLTERNLLLKNAHHVVHPQICWVPLRSWLGGAVGAVLRFFRLKRTPGPKGAIPVKIGLMLYDTFGRAHQTMPNHRMLMARKARAEVTGLSPTIKAVAEYYDARITHPERLVTEIASDAEADCPAAMAIPYMAAGALEDGSVTLHDTLTGETFRVRPKVVLNASGAWVDKVHARLGIGQRMIGGTRGSHLVLRNAQVAADLGDRMLYFETDDHRACLIYRMEGDRVLAGTTDIRSDDPDDKFCTEAEIDYIFDVLRPILPGAHFDRSQIVFAFAGVRPLPLQNTSATGAISRDHRLEQFAPTADRPFPMVSLIGGKWTTYRVCGEQMADAVMKLLGQSRTRTTEGVAIGGAAGLPKDPAELRNWTLALSRASGLTVERCTLLARRYGSAAHSVAQAEAAAHQPYRGVTGYSPAEIAHICRIERVCRLEDIVLRRTLMGFEGAVTREGLGELAATAAPILGWTAGRVENEVDRTASLLRERHRMSIA